MGRDRWRALALVLVGAAAFAAAFPPLDLWPLAFVAPVPLLAAVRRASRGRAFVLGWLFGTVGATVCVASSLLEASAQYFEHAPLTAVLFAIAMPQLCAAPHVGLFGLAARELLRDPQRGVLASIAVPASWVASEFARAKLSVGLPWLLLAHSQHDVLPLLQIADVTGAFGVSFVVMSVAMALLTIGDAATGGSPLRPGPLVVPVLVAAGALVYGGINLPRWRALAGPELRVGLVQGGIPLAWRRSAPRAAEALRRLRELTAELRAARPTLVVWPENAVGFALAGNEALFAAALDDLDPQSRLLVGAPRAVERPGGRVEFRNAAFLLVPGGRVAAHYDKLRLTPFAEYAPWPAGAFARRRHAPGDVYAPGDAWTLFEVAGHRFATLICSEAIYADLVRRFVGAGAEFLVNISNDDWFGARAAVMQHLHAALLAAVEHRRALIRVTNTGITAVVAPTGAVVATAPAGAAATLVATVIPVRELGIYTRYGDVFAWLCVAVAGLGVAVSRRPGDRA